MTFENAGAAEILRAVQKDNTFLDSLKANVAELIQKTLGTQYWLKYHKWIDKFCELLYFSLTTLALRQTLGEEYSGLLMISKSKRALPSSLVRIAMISLQCLGPLTYGILIKRLEQSINSGFLAVYLKLSLKETLQNKIVLLKALPSVILKLHLATFYLRGAFYHLAKRITGIRYVLIRSWFGDSSVVKSFRLLGFIVLLNSFLGSLYSLWEERNITKDTPAQDESGYDRQKCSLCLDRRKNPCVTPCGHLFCWNCLQESLQESNDCPLCRHPVLPRQVVPLMNFE